MRPEIKEIIANQSMSVEEKQHILYEFQESINLAEKYLTEYRYCPHCQEFYISKSFFIDTSYEEENVCTYSDPINSGGNEYERRRIKYTNLMCPKGHVVEEINREDLGRVR